MLHNIRESFNKLVHYSTLCSFISLEGFTQHGIHQLDKLANINEKAYANVMSANCVIVQLLKSVHAFFYINHSIDTTLHGLTVMQNRSS